MSFIYKSIVIPKSYPCDIFLTSHFFGGDIWMWVRMEDLGNHRCESSLVLTIQFLGYLILTHTHLMLD